MRIHKPLWIVIIFYLIAISILFIVSQILNMGEFVYALDDAYIHMSMADNFVNFGNWATNKIDFASATSSPLWVLIISLDYSVFGKNIAAPFIMNLIFQLFAIVTAYFLLRKYGIKKYLVSFLLAFVFISPFPALLFSGMEHSAQIFLTILFVFLSIRLILQNEPDNKKILLLLIVTLFFAGIRYEDLIIVSIICLLFFLKGRKLTALLILFAGLVPLLIYGYISTSHGWFFIPNTLLLKGSLPGFTAVGLVRFCFRAFSNITEPHVFILLIIISSVFIINLKKYKSFWDEKQLMLFISALAIIINMSIIDYNHNGAFYRYEAYLMALGIISVIININNLLPDFLIFLNALKSKFFKYTVVAFIFVVISPLVVRAFTVFGVPHATLEYHNQQYQMAQFCRLYAKDMNIALNDIGMVNYYTDNKVFDLLGLSDIEIARQRLNGSLSTNSIEILAKKDNVRLVICYEKWFDQYGGLPASWKKTAEWTMNDYNFFLGNSTVSFYTTNVEDERYIKEKLNEFAGKLPKSVSFKIIL